MKLNKDESLLFAMGNSGEILIWDVQTGQLEKALLGHRGPGNIAGYRHPRGLVRSGSDVSGVESGLANHANRV